MTPKRKESGKLIEEEITHREECDGDVDEENGHICADAPIVPVKVERVGGRGWRLAPPASETHDVNDCLIRAQCALDDGDQARAIGIMKDLASRYPNNIQALDHTARLFDAFDVPDAAAFFWNRALAVGRASLEDGFFERGNTLPWELGENRSLLKAMLGQARMAIRHGLFDEALQALNLMSDSDPDDHLGASADIIFCGFCLNRMDEVLRACERHPNSALPEVVFGRILALYRTGRKEEAMTRAAEAAVTHPLCIRQMFHPLRRHPKCDAGPESDAYHHWLEFKRFWHATAGALAMMKEAQRVAKRDRRGLV